MIIGEEGYGSWGCGRRESKGYNNKPWEMDAVEEIQTYNREQTLMQVSPKLLDEERQKKYSVIESSFWRRFKRIYYINAGIPCIWNNINKVHRLMEQNESGQNTCPLSAKEEKILHSTKTHVLEEEIRILEPTLVVFFGWHHIPLKMELNDVFNELYKGEKKYKKPDWETNPDIIEDKKRSIKYVFAYHPGYKTIAYETFICDLIKKLLT